MTSQGEKKKKSIIGRILKYTGIFLVVLIGIIIAIPFFFKDKLKDLALAEANKMLKAEVAVGDFDLTIFSTFPKLKLQFDNVSIIGKDDFEGIKLVDLKSLEAKLDFWSVVKMDDISVRSIRLIEPNINVQILPSGVANYDIVKSDEELKEEEATESSPFKFSLEYYEIKDGNIIFNDRASNLYAEIKNLNHSGKGDLTADVIDFKTLTSIDELTFKMDNMSYLNKVKTNLDMNLLMEFKDESSKFTLKENTLSLNALNLSFDGFYEMLEDYDNIDLKLNADKTSFKELLSLIPTFYLTGYESMVAKGNLSLDAFVKGKMDEDNLPAWDVNLKVTDASIKYPDMPANINNVQIVAGSKFPGGTDLDKMTIDVDQLKASFVGNTIDANFYMKNPLTDPFMKSKIDAKIDLTTIKQVYPMEETQQLNGKLTSNLALEGRMSAIEKEQYDKFKAEGTLQLKEFRYTSADLPAPVDIADMLFEFSPQQLKLANLDATMGKSDFKMSGNVENYMAYIFKGEELKGLFNYHSNVLDLDEILPASEETETTEESVAQTTGSDEPISIPDKIDFTLLTTVDKAKYNGIDVDNVKGKVMLKNQEANLENLSMNAMGGSIGLSGKFNTQDAQNPNMEFSYSLKELDIQQLANNFLTIDKLAPIAKYVKGSISSDFTMNTKLTPSLDLVYNSLNGNGSFFSSKIQVSDFKPLDKLADALQMNKLKSQTLENIKATFEFTDGKVFVKPFNVKMGKINTVIGGNTSLNQDIDYEIKMEIPKSEIPGSVMKVAEQAIAQAKKIPFFEIKELPEKIPVTALVTNTITDPKIKTNMKEKLMEMGGDIKDNIKNLVDDKVKEVKDTVKAIVDDKINQAKEELEKQKQKIMDEAQKQADNVKAEAKKLANKTRDEANKNAQKLITEAGANPIKKAAAEVTAKQLRDEGEKSAKKIENEAQKQADDIMKKAQEEADKLK
ncbi:MAG: hypothetical protein M9897_05940 [Brumimicrobium sp.]|nr:hypothetical protein [Brumimicrobium sp.]